jgi:two-component system LytT family response regulator
MINAIIVDDEPYCCEALSILLGRYCPQVNLAGMYFSGAQAMDPIRDQKPQLLFLDIEMPRMNGFELLEKVKDLDFELIFTTSYDQYAIKAIRHSALDYLLKPIDREELQLSIRKAEQRLRLPCPSRFDLLFQKLQSPTNLFTKIAIPTMEGLADGGGGQHHPLSFRQQLYDPDAQGKTEGDRIEDAERNRGAAGRLFVSAGPSFACDQSE